MQFGLILAEHPHRMIRASEVEIGDCTAKQIKCPECMEAVFKVQSQSRHYLSHYPNQGRMDCGFRVTRLGLRYFNARMVVPSDQDLAGHLAQFEEILLENCMDRVASVRQINRMRARRSFCYMISDNQRWFREYLQGATANMEMEPEFRTCLDHVQQFLTAQNSGRSLIFAACFGCAKMGGLLPTTTEKGWEALKEANDFEAFVLLSDAKFKRYFLNALDKASDRQGRQDHWFQQLGTAIGQTSLDFVLRVIDISD